MLLRCVKVLYSGSEPNRRSHLKVQEELRLRVKPGQEIRLDFVFNAFTLSPCVAATDLSCLFHRP